MICLDVVNFISYGVSKFDDEVLVNLDLLEEGEFIDDSGFVFSKYLIDLNKYVKEGKIDLFIGWDLEVECMI